MYAENKRKSFYLNNFKRRDYFGKKLVYIESFAKISSPTETGKFLYKFADRFYVQWKSMKKFYPNAIYLGGIY